MDTSKLRSELHIGYKRVSTLDQSTDRQLEGIAISFIFEDKVSGKDTERPALQRLMQDQNMSLTHDVILHIHSLDRLARNLSDLESIVKTLTSKGWTIIFHKENMTFCASKEDPMQRLMLQVFGAVAQFERSLIRERQREGIALAKVRGVYKGRKQALNEAEIQELRTKASSGMNKSTLAKEFKISRSSLYNYL